MSDRLRPTRRSRNLLVKSRGALMAANGWTGGMDKHGDFEGLLFAEPYGDEVQSKVKKGYWRIHGPLSRIDEETTADDGGVRPH